MSFNATATFQHSPAEVISLLPHVADAATPLNVGYALIGLAIAMELYKSYKKRGTIAVITEGHSDFIRSHFSASQFLQNAKDTLNDCYNKYNKATFRVPTMEQWLTIISKPELIEEIRKAPDDRFSISSAVSENTSSKYTFGRTFYEHDYETNVVRKQLTQSLGTKFDDVRDEVELAFKEYVTLPENSNDWVAIPIHSTIINVVSRASNRIFVGAPMCRDKAWLEFNVNYTMDIAKKSAYLRKVPGFIRPIVGTYMRMTDDSVSRAMSIIKPVFEERFKKYEEMGSDWPGKPIDLVTWFIEAAPPETSRDMMDYTRRVLMTNVAALYTTSHTFVHVLLHLAAEQKYVETIRSEVEQITSQEGWTKDAMAKMQKLDSFIRESQRFDGIGITSLTRKAMKDTVLSDGTFIPRGTFVSANMTAIHNNPDIYPSPHEFQPWRFAELREKLSEDDPKYQAVSTSADFLAFGHGRHACPGRFFVMNEMKIMMAHIVLNYDVRTEQEGVRPPNVYPNMGVLPNPTAKVLFRRRIKV